MKGLQILFVLFWWYFTRLKSPQAKRKSKYIQNQKIFESWNYSMPNKMSFLLNIFYNHDTSIHYLSTILPCPRNAHTNISSLKEFKT